MDFGKVPYAVVGNVDFRLPPDLPVTGEVLQQVGKTERAPRLFAGCAKWGRKEWVGKIYPAGTKEKDFLQQYVQQFNSIELNATHYQIYGPAVIGRWAAVARERDFIFCPKFPQRISHYSRLTETEMLTAAFFEGILAFGEHLGPCFLQLSERFSPRRWQELRSYLESLPRDLKFFLEVRHPQWFEDTAIREELFRTLRDQQIGAVITDTSGRRDCAHMGLTIPSAFVRFVGNNLHPTDYSRLDEWVQRIGYWLEHGLQELYFFMHQHDEKDSPELCAYLINELNKHCGTQLRPPHFQQQLF